MNMNKKNVNKKQTRRKQTNYKIIDKKDYCFIVNNKNYLVNYINKNMKNMKLTIKQNNNIVVTGHNLSEERIRSFILKHIDWIDKTLNLNLKKENIIDYQKYIDGKVMWIFGKSYKVNYIDNNSLKKNDLFIDSDNVYVKSVLSVKELFNLVKEKNIEYLINRVNEYSKIFNHETNLVLKDMKSKYGYNRYKDNIICLSKRLIHYPKIVIDYVIIHEFCHYYVHNHSKDFYDVVKKYMPEYKEVLKLVKKYNLLIKY